MNKRRNAPLAVLAVGIAGVAMTSWFLATPRPVDVELRFHVMFDGQPLVFHQPCYANPGGSGQFAVSDFRMFVSNLSLRDADGVDFAETDSYHLLRFDVDTARVRVQLSAVPRADYNILAFGVGVDPAANRNILPRGDLDPNSRMAWSWDVGYKFVLFEGRLHNSDTTQPLVYHVGFDESYQAVELQLGDASITAGLDLSVDLRRLFDGRETIDMAALPSVKFDPADAARVASNFGQLVSISPTGPNGTASSCGAEGVASVGYASGAVTQAVDTGLKATRNTDQPAT